MAAARKLCVTFDDPIALYLRSADDTSRDLYICITNLHRSLALNRSVKGSLLWGVVSPDCRPPGS